MSLFAFQWWGIIGVMILLISWNLVNWSVIAQDSGLNLLIQLAGSVFFTIEAFRPTVRRSTFIKGSMYVLSFLFFVIAIADYVPQF
ncbi:MAG: hypothetical protein V4606_01170 [Patescibacteria group bacterium]